MIGSPNTIAGFRTAYPDGSFMLAWQKMQAWFNADGTLKDAQYKRMHNGQLVTRAVSPKHVHVRAWLDKQGKSELAFQKRINKPLPARPLSFADAKARYVHRYTMEYLPSWARKPSPNGKYYAPQYASDREWYENTIFPGEKHIPAKADHCESNKQTWPLGQWLNAPYQIKG